MLELDVAVRRVLPRSTAARCSASCRSRCGKHEAPPDARNRITLAMRPLDRPRRAHDDHRRRARRQGGRRSSRGIYGVDRATDPRPHARRGRASRPRTIDIVLASAPAFRSRRRLHRPRRGGRLRPRFPRAQYVVRRGEWEDATHPHAQSRASYLADNYVPLADAGVLQLVDDDATIMPGVKVRRTGGHTHAPPDGADRVGRQDAPPSSPI